MTRAAFPLTAEGAALFPRVPALHGIREAAHTHGAHFGVKAWKDVEHDALSGKISADHL